MDNTSPKKTIFSGIQPTGRLTLGNYLGAVRNWKLLEDEYDCIYSVVDLHAITVRQEKSEFRRQCLSTLALLMACGLSPEKTVMFFQSHVPAHAELAWILNCYTMFGELSRMTQFKDKAASNADNVNAGLFTYPALMAADILLYNTGLVPVGQDQKQHLELSRTIAERFNHNYGDIFTVPDPYIPKLGTKIMSLADPEKKMSKSDPNENAVVAILDKPDDIMRKFRRAVTDSEACVKYGEGRDGINNLITIYSTISGKSFDGIEREFDGRGYGDFKLAVGESVKDLFAPIRETHDRLMADKTYLEQIYKSGAEKAFRVAARTLAKVYKRLGFVSK